MNERLRAWVRSHVPDFVHCGPLAGGYRNENLLLEAPTGDRFVLRRYLAGGPCAVEAALATRVAHTVPVAEVIATDPTGDRTGEPVLLMRFVPGTLVSRVLPTAERPEELGRAVGETLARIGTAQFDRPGFFTGPDLTPTPVDTPLPEFVDDCLRRHEGLTEAERSALRRLAEREAPLAGSVRGVARLVHSDYNPKNLLVTGPQWTVTAVLDWEFAYSGSPLADLGNMLRFEETMPPAYVAGFVAGYASGAPLPDGWRAVSRALDLYALADLLTRPHEHRYSRRAIEAVRRRLAGTPISPIAAT